MQMRMTMKRTGLALICGALFGESALAQTEVMAFGAGAMIQPPNGPAITLSPTETGTVLQAVGGPPMPLPTAGTGTSVATTPAGPPMQIKPFGSSTIIETPGQPAVICTPLAGRIACN